jgi:hypothetical protein
VIVREGQVMLIGYDLREGRCVSSQNTFLDSMLISAVGSGVNDAYIADWQ